MTDDHTRWELQLRELRIRSQQLSAELTLAAQELREQGMEPPAELISRLDDFRTSFQELKTELRSRFSEAQTATSLEDLQTVLANHAQVEAALEVLDTAARLQHREVTGFPPLSRVWDQCRSVREELLTTPPAREAASALLEGRHPLAALVHLVCAADTLSDERWQTLQELVASQFGRELATAVVRGRVTDSAA